MFIFKYSRIEPFSYYPLTKPKLASNSLAYLIPALLSGKALDSTPRSSGAWYISVFQKLSRNMMEGKELWISNIFKFH